GNWVYDSMFRRSTPPGGGVWTASPTHSGDLRRSEPPVATPGVAPGGNISTSGGDFGDDQDNQIATSGGDFGDDAGNQAASSGGDFGDDNAAAGSQDASGGDFGDNSEQVADAGTGGGDFGEGSGSGDWGCGWFGG